MIEIILLILSSLSIILWISYFIITMRHYNLMPILTKKSFKKSDKIPLVSIIIPARNESQKIKKCIKSIKLQTYSKLEIIIVNDHSTDDTSDIIKDDIKDDKRFKLLDLNGVKGKKSNGWSGKSYAMQEGSKIAKGEWILFVDADIYLHPEIVESAVYYVIKNKLDMCSLLPHNICKSFWEKVIQPIPIGAIIGAFPLSKVNSHRSKIAVAYGYFILIKHPVFDKLHGYKTIKDKVADDVQLAKLVKHSGFKIGLIKAQNIMKVRMYNNFNEIWNGWSKNVFLSAVQNRQIKSKIFQVLISLMISICVFSMIVLPFLLAVIGLYRWEYLLTIPFLLQISIQFRVNKHYHIGDPKYVFLSPLGGVIFIGIILTSMAKNVFGKGVSWKGRNYSNIQ